MTSSYWPEQGGNAPYVTEVAEHFASQGTSVTVATGFPHYPRWERTTWAPTAVDVLRGVTIRRWQHAIPKRQSIWGRVRYESTQTLALLAGAIQTRRPDAILAYSPSLAGGVAAATIARTVRRPFGLVFQDLMGVGAIEAGVSGSRAAAAVARIEYGIARQALAVGIVTEGFRPHLRQGGVADERISLLRNWSRHSPLDGAEDREAARARFGWREEDFVCVHAGNMGRKQDLSNVLASAALLPPPIRVVFVGDGNDRERLESESRELGLTNVDFLGSQTDEAYARALLAADLLIVNQKPTVEAMSFPSKLGSYLAAGRPVVAAVAAESEAGKALSEAGAAKVVSAGDPHGLADAIRTVRADSGSAANLVLAGRRYAEQALSREAGLARYEEFVSNLLARA